MTPDTNSCRYGRGWGRQQERAGTLGAPTRSYGAQMHLPLLNKGDKVSRQYPPKGHLPKGHHTAEASGLDFHSVQCH